VKYHVAEDSGLYYKLNVKNMGSPFDFYMGHNDDVVFLTNSMDRMEKYSKGKKACNLGMHKKLLKKGMFNMYVNSSESMQKLSKVFPIDQSMTDYVGQNFTDLYMTMSKIKGNKINYDLVVKTNKKAGNSLKLLFSSYGEIMSFMEDSRRESF
jgi:hypothetical protein